ncbi:aldose 1-epimerase family protein [Shivajiella indica]|uniref:Aldose 1-epimerase family protein n=1 Tax=Shivajiella indica TaxID=872115 RepID=A0ABW5BDR0_9BACT
MDITSNPVILHSRNKVSNHSQLGGIETSVLDNGPGMGVRIAWVNTGTGLRYKIVLDRGMDIADALYNAYSLAWISHAGVIKPQPFSNQGIDWLRTFAGGLLTTCGLSHIGGPETDEHGSRGLHGNYSNIPAEIISVQQPDLTKGKLEMSITGVVRETTTFGPNLELRRTISGILGEPSIKIHDEIRNLGNTPAPHMLLYHINCGYPLIDQGTDILWKGEWESMDKNPNNRIFNQSNDFRKCPAPMDEHAGFGEDVAFIVPTADANGTSVCGFVNQKLGLGLSIKFNTYQLPWLINWQHWGKGEYVTALEPATNPPIGQAKARNTETLIDLAPGEKRNYDLELQVITQPEELENLLKINKK